MKFDFDLTKKKATFDADVERLIEKKMENNKGRVPKKTRYQIRQEEKRKNKEQKLKHALILIACYVGLMLLIILSCSIGCN